MGPAMTSGKLSDMMKWKMSLAESLAFATTVAIVVTWVHSTFQAKSEAVEWKTKVESRMDGLEKKFDDGLATMRTDVGSVRDQSSKIAVDVSYIRGRLEPPIK